MWQTCINWLTDKSGSCSSPGNQEHAFCCNTLCWTQQRASCTHASVAVVSALLCTSPCTVLMVVSMRGRQLPLPSLKSFCWLHDVSNAYLYLLGAHLLLLSPNLLEMWPDSIVFPTQVFFHIRLELLLFGGRCCVSSAGICTLHVAWQGLYVGHTPCGNPHLYVTSLCCLQPSCMCGKLSTHAQMFSARTILRRLEFEKEWVDSD